MTWNIEIDTCVSERFLLYLCGVDMRAPRCARANAGLRFEAAIFEVPSARGTDEI
jgi:hypothetical protein